MADAFGDKPFNMSEEFLRALIELRKKITEQVIGGSMYAWYRSVMEYWNMCYFEFSPDENANLNKLLGEVKNMLNHPQNKFGQQLMNAKIHLVEDKLNEVTRLLHVYLNNHERIFKKSAYSSWEDEVKEDFL